MQYQFFKKEINKIPFLYGEKRKVMKKVIILSVLLIFSAGQISLSAPKARKVKKSESQKMKSEIDRIEKRVNEINKNIEDYKVNEVKLDELEEKHSETVRDLRLD